MRRSLSPVLGEEGLPMKARFLGGAGVLRWRARLGALASVVAAVGGVLLLAPSADPVPWPTYLVSGPSRAFTSTQVHLLHDLGVRDLSLAADPEVRMSANSVVVFDGCPQTLGVSSAMMQRLYVQQAILVGYHCPLEELTKAIGNRFITTFNSAILGPVPDSFIQDHVQANRTLEAKAGSTTTGYSVVAGLTVTTSVTTQTPAGLARGLHLGQSGNFPQGGGFASLVNNVLRNPASRRPIMGVVRG